MGRDNTYTCAEYREEMMLLGLRRRLTNHTITEDKTQALLREIERLKISIDIN